MFLKVAVEASAVGGIGAGPTDRRKTEGKLLDKAEVIERISVAA
jgi:hypothetical protein